jgi:hypothetical protein
MRHRFNAQSAVMVQHPMSLCVSGSEIRRIKQTCPEIMRKNRSLVEVLLDFLQPFTKSPYSVGVGGVKVSDVESRNRCKSFTTAITTIIPGPNQPNTLYPYLQPLVEDLSRTSVSGMRVPASFGCISDAEAGGSGAGRAAPGGTGLAAGGAGGSGAGRAAPGGTGLAAGGAGGSGAGRAAPGGT